MTYAGLALLFVFAAACVAAACWLLVRPPRRWYAGVAVVALALILLTAVFDSVMIWADLFRFDEQMLLGVRIGLAPLEDFAWPVAAALLLPAVWEAMGRWNRRRRSRIGTGGGGGSP